MSKSSQNRPSRVGSVSLKSAGRGSTRAGNGKGAAGQGSGRRGSGVTSSAVLGSNGRSDQGPAAKPKSPDSRKPAQNQLGAVTVPYIRLAELPESMHRAVSFLLVLLLALYFTTTLHEPAFYWHVLLGDWIREHGQLPFNNQFSLVGYGLEFYSSSWLFDLGVATVFLHYGGLGAVTLKALLVLCFLSTAGSIFARQAKSSFLGGFLLAALAAGLFVRSQLTPDLYNYTFFLLVCHFFYRAKRAKTNSYVLAVFFPLAVLSANIAVTPVLCSGLGLVLFSAVCCFGNDRGLSFGERRAARMLSLGSLLCLASLLTPYLGKNIFYELGRVRTYFFEVLLAGADARFIADYRVGILFLLTVALFLSQLKSPRSIRRSELVFLAVILVLSCAASSLAPYLLIAASYLAAVLLGRGLQGLGNVGKGLDLLHSLLSRLPAYALMFLLCCLVYISGTKLYKHPVSNLLLPAAELEQLMGNPALTAYLPLYHPSELGGYVGRQFHRRILDSRVAQQILAPNFEPPAIPSQDTAETKFLETTPLPQLHEEFPAESLAAFSEQLVLSYPELAQAEQSVLNATGDWRRYFDGILGAKSALVPRGSPLVNELLSSGQWCEFTFAVTSPTDFPQRLIESEWQILLRSAVCEGA